MYLETTLVNNTMPMLEVLRQLHHLSISGNNLFDLLIAGSIALYFKDRIQEHKDAGNMSPECAAGYLIEARFILEAMEERIKTNIQN